MINNRQNGRRRGRGGQPQRNGTPGTPDRGNRLDNRARGNASQLHEKYKTLARDAQMQGDRVTTEYYLQFADHYFRVLSESRARFEEQRRPRDDYRGQNDGDGDDGYDAAGDDEDGDDGYEAEVADRDDRAPRDGNGRYDEGRYNRTARDYNDRGDGREGNDRDGNGRDTRDRSPAPEGQRDGQQRDRQRRDTQPRDNQPRDTQPRDNQPRDNQPREHQPREDRQRQPRAEQPRAEQPRVEQPRTTESLPMGLEGEAFGRQPRAPRRRERTNGQAANGAVEGDEPRERIEVDRLPPAFSAEPRPAAAADEPVAPAAPDDEKPRRRVRRPRTDAVEAEA